MVHTHVSVVFLAGDYAYKVRKPVDLGFLDFTTLERRRADCEAEVLLNRRLAPSVYLGVVPITTRNGRVAIGGGGFGGEAVEYAVRMERLPEEATLRSLLARGRLDRETVELVARRVADFHAEADTGKKIARQGRFKVVAANARENFLQTQEFRGGTVSAAVWAWLRDLTETELAARWELIEARARPGVILDGHGDLHLDHVYRFPGREPPSDVVIVDCIEFSDRFRHLDPVADAAFLAMDLELHGRRDLARTFSDAYFEASGDDEGRALLPFYTAYRAVVRGKVASFEVQEEEVPAAQRWEALQRARAHFLLALGILAPPAERPCMVLAAGLPGTGKSALARGLEAEAGFVRIATDAVRKELAGLAPDEPAPAELDRGIYSPGATERTYAVCLERAGEMLFEGRRVVVDATFREEERRREMLAAARAWGVPGLVLVCEAGPEEVRGRLERRAAAGGDPSDADWRIYRALAERWEEASAETAAALHRIDTSGSPEESLAQALEVLRGLELD